MYTEKKEAQNFSAFPCAAFGPSGDDIHQRGMSMRDWFAGMALTGLLQQGYDQFDPKEFSTQAFQYADAMMEARVQNGNLS